MIPFILYVILSSAGIILFKLGASNLSVSLTKNVFDINISLVSILGLVCYLLSFVLWMYILTKKDVSFIVPLGLGLTNVLILLGSYFVLGETLSAMNIIGAIIIVSGVIIISI